jgi:surface antigen
MAYKKRSKIKKLICSVLEIALLLQLVLVSSLTVCAADYSGGGCVRWARYRTQQVYGITLPSTTNQPSGVYGASNWWYSLPSKYPRGQVPEANCLAIWSGGSASFPNYGHVAYVESVNADGSLTLTEGGFSSSTYTDSVTGEIHTGVRCSTVTTMVRRNYTFLGYVYLDGIAPDDENIISMYRLYNPNSGEHFYTGNASEMQMLSSIGWNYEGVAWTAPACSGTPVYRLYNPNAGDHHYTTDVSERDHLVSVGWRYEGIGWYSAPNTGVPLYRQYNPNAVAGTHNYTVDKSENDHLASVGWREEGISWYGL